MSLKIFLLGQFNLQVNDLSLNVPSRPAQSLLAYLVIHPGVEHRREKLAALLWPETPESNARSYLRQALWRLRKTFAGSPLSWQDYLQIHDISIRFKEQSDYWLDADQLTAPQEFQSIESMIEVIKLYKGELLPGFYDQWIVLERDRISAAYQQKMSNLLDCLVDMKQWNEVLMWSEDWISHGYTPEPAYRALMLAHAGKGDQSQVMTTFQRCSEALDRELGVDPSLETQQLFEKLRDHGAISKTLNHATPPTQPGLPPFLIKSRPKVEKILFVSRERELNRLESQLNEAKAGRGSVTLITGEAGSGKTSLIQEFTHRTINANPDVIIANGNCNAHSGIGDTYLPFREILELLTGDVESLWQANAISDEHALLLWNAIPLTAQALLEVGPDLIDTFIPGTSLMNRATNGIISDSTLLDDLKQLENRKSASTAIPNPLQQNLLNQYTKVLQFLAQRRLLIIIIDDLQWADPGSISLLFHLGRKLKGCNLLIIGAYRPEEVAIDIAGDRHPLIPVINEFQREYGDIFINLDETDSLDFVKSIIDSEPNRLQPSFTEMLYKQTRGHPLFTIELLRGLQNQGNLIQDQQGFWIEGPNLDWDTMPGRIEAVIAERIGRLSESMQQILRIASVEGETFTAEILAQVQDIDEKEILTCLSSELERKHQLVKAQSIKRMDGQLLSTYKFQHFLFQKYLYNCLNEIERVHLHDRVGNALERLYGNYQERVNLAPSLARHFHEAHNVDKEIEYLRQSGERAIQMSAYQDAITHLTESLELLMTLPESRERSERELALQLGLGQAWRGPQGVGPDVKSAFTRARQLCEELGEDHKLCQVLGQFSLLHFVKAEYQIARELGEEALRLAEQLNDPLLIALGHWYLGFILFFLGDIKISQKHLEHIIRFYDAGLYHRTIVLMRESDAGISAIAYDALCSWILGYKDQAYKKSKQVIDLTRDLNHPLSLADAICYAGCWLYSMENDADNLMSYSQELVDISIENEFAGWTGIGFYFFGEALARKGQIEEGISRINEGIASEISLSVDCSMVCALRSLAGAQYEGGLYDEGLLTIQKALSLVEITGERLWEADIYRIQAQLLLSLGKDQDAEVSLHKSIQIAQQQNGKSWELRTTTELARLWSRQGKQEEALHALTEIYEWFTEGFTSPDLVKARMLIEELS